MANKKISELVSRTPSLTDLMLVGDPSSGYSYKCTITELSTLLEANITLNDLNNVVITAPTNGQVLTYNGTNWVNGNNGITEINGLNAASQSFSVGTSGTDFAIVSSISTHTFNLPTASATNRGALSSADWSTFNSKIGGSGTTNYLSKFTGTSTIGNSLLFDNGTNVGIGTINPSTKLDVNGDVKISTIANATTDTDRFLVSDSGVIKYRTGSEVLSDIGGAAASSISGTTNYIPKFSASGSINNSQLYQDGNLICIGTTTGSSALTVNGDITLFNGRGIFGKNIAGTGNSFSLLDTGLVFSEYISDPVLQSSPSISNITLNSNGSISLGNIAAATTDTDRFIVSDSGVIKYRTGTQVLSDIGGAAASSISGTTNYIPKFTSSSAIGNSQIFDNGTNVGIGTTNPSGTLDIRTTSGLSFRSQSNDGTATNNAGFLIYNTPSATQSSRTVQLVLDPNGANAINGDYLLIDYSGDGIANFNNLQSGGYFIWTTGGNERMRLTASGNLGLGTSNPVSKFETFDGDISVTTQNSFSFFNANRNFIPNASGVLLGGLKFRGYSTGTTYQVGSQIYGYSSAAWTSTSTPSYLSFQTTPSGSTSPTERMVLNASGNLGLGVTPSAWGASFKVLQIGGVSSIYTESSVATKLVNNSFFSDVNRYYANGEATQYAQQFGQHVWYTAPFGTAGNAISFTQAMTLDASGNLGIGTTSASSFSMKLAVVNNIGLIPTTQNTVGSAVFLKSQLGSSGGENFISNEITTFNNAANYNTSLIFLTRSGTSVAERMRITSGGNVGIGTTNPQNKLVVAGTLGNFEVLNGGNELQFSRNGQNYILAVGGSNSLLSLGGIGGTLFFSGSPIGEKMRLTSSGELLINTTSDAGDYKLQVNGNSYIGGELYIKAASGYNVLFQNSATTLRLNYLNDAGSANISAAYRATDFNWQDGSGNQMFLLNSSGNAEFASSLKIGGNFTTPISIKTGNYTLGASDYTVVFDISTDTNATLPDATTCTGRIYTIKANVSTTDKLSIVANGSQTIDGASSIDLQCKGSVIIQSDGSNWRILSIYQDGTCL